MIQPTESAASSAIAARPVIAELCHITKVFSIRGAHELKVLDEIEEKTGHEMTVDVFSQQYAWSFGYPGKDYAYSQGVLHVPVKKPNGNPFQPSCESLVLTLFATPHPLCRGKSLIPARPVSLLLNATLSPAPSQE